MKTYCCLYFLTLLVSPAFGVYGKSLIQVDNAEPHIKPSKTKNVFLKLYFNSCLIFL